MVFDMDFDYEACFIRDSTLKKSDIDELKKWAENLTVDSTVPKDITHKQLLVFHLACDQVIELTKKCVKAHYNLRLKIPDQFNNRDVISEEIIQVQEAQEFIFLPEKTKEGYGIMLHRLHDFNVENYNYVVGCKYFSMVLDSYINEHGPDKGLVMLYDMREAKFGHLTRVPIRAMSNYLEYSQNGINIQIISIHVFNVTPIFNAIMKMISPFMKGDLIKRIVLHPPNMNWEEFYKNVLPKRCLPSDFGGDLPNTQIVNKQNIERVRRHQQYFNEEEKQRHRYTKKKPNKMSGFADID